MFGLPAPGSPAIDVANTASASAEDLLGNPRGALPDLGALESNPVIMIFADGFES